MLLEQLNKVFSNEEPIIPEEIIFANLNECTSMPTLAQCFERSNYNIVGTNTLNDIKFCFNFFCNKLQKLCNNNMKILTPIKIALIGSDFYVNSFLRIYVDLLANKSPEWQNFFRFYIIPLNMANNHSSITLHRYLASIDNTYSNCFFAKDSQDSSRNNETFLDNCVGANMQLNDFCNKVFNYMNTAQTLIQIPIAEAMITYRDKNIDDDSNQTFIPFICDIRIGK